ncbi:MULTISPECIES: hypothetical protein [unclassified Curtobacterium]|uniref:hypothetical protein n=1 Tax=unclassified Curtobacterium TaxID=257496 RepID=UPI0011B7F452|nr:MULTISPECIES: hypothetical protein [unclassified Curtobacterium]
MGEEPRVHRPDRWRVLRDVLIAVPPGFETVVVIVGLVASIDAPYESERAWAPWAWPARATLCTFPLALVAVAVAVGLRRVPGRTAAIWLAAASAALGVLPFVVAVQIALRAV